MPVADEMPNYMPYCSEVFETMLDIEPVIKRIRGMVGGIYTAIDSVSIGTPKLVKFPSCCIGDVSTTLL